MLLCQEIPPMLTEAEKRALYENWGEESWKILAERHIRLAIKIAKSFFNTGVDKDDLVSTSLLYLALSAKKFNPNMGIQFSVYAVPTIRGGILNELRRQRKDSLYQANRFEEFVANGKEMGEDSSSNVFEDDVILKEDVSNALAELNERDRMIILLFLNGFKQKEISQNMKISGSYTKRVIHQFYRRVRNSKS